MSAWVKPNRSNRQTKLLCRMGSHHEAQVEEAQSSNEHVGVIRTSTQGLATIDFLIRRPIKDFTAGRHVKTHCGPGTRHNGFQAPSSIASLVQNGGHTVSTDQTEDESPVQEVRNDKLLRQRITTKVHWVEPGRVNEQSKGQKVYSRLTGHSQIRKLYITRRKHTGVFYDKSLSRL